MRAWGRRIAYGVAALAGLVGILYVAVPPARTPAEGSPDPILWIRKPIVKGLYRMGLPSPFLTPDHWIPSAASSTTWAGEAKTPEAAEHSTVQTWEYQPVYRGLFWQVGARATYKVDIRGDAKSDPHHLRLWWKGEDGKEITVADGGPMTPDVASGRRRWRVDGFVPSAATSAGFHWVMPDGTTRSGTSWSED